MKLSARQSALAVVSVLMLTMLVSSTSADHSWNGYHWARSANPVHLTLGDNLTGDWGAYLDAAEQDWDQSRVLDLAVGPGAASKRNCKPAAGAIEICNGAYGFNQWLGIAQISVSGKHITSGSVRVNDSYFNTSTYNSPAWRQLVICQEVGHTFGLDHQDEDFNNTPLGTCMDYSSDPNPNQHPNAHDYDELEIIYSHLDSPTGGAPVRGAHGQESDSPSDWGQLMRSSHGGRLQVFERDFGGGRKLVTFVIWA